MSIVSHGMAAAIVAMIAPGVLNARPTGPLAEVRRANQEATVGPRQGDFVNATELYPWSEGAIFRLYTSPGRVSDIALEAGETLVSVAAGDTVRWIVGNTASGSGETRREHILIKPTAAGLTTNLFILTSRHSYHIDVVSTPGSAMASVSWSYPKDSLISLQGTPPAPSSPASQDAIPAADPTALRFGYTISGDDMPWRPLRAFDDGRHVYIEFPAGIMASSAPPLFVTDGKAPELVNYRMRGRYYVVDRLFSHAELRIGDKPQHIVRIVLDSRGRAS
jgi:type IV secretion system protein VirB9